MVLTQTLSGCPSSEQGISVKVDRRTPRSTFDTFTRAVLKGQPEALWTVLDKPLRNRLKQQALAAGEESLLRRLEALIINAHGMLTLGEESPAGDQVFCGLMRAGHRVGTASFRFDNLGWSLASLG